MTDDEFWNEMEIHKVGKLLLKAHDNLAEANRFVKAAAKQVVLLAIRRADIRK